MREVHFDAEMCAITARAVDPAAVEDDTVRRIEEEARCRVAGVRNPRRAEIGLPPLYEGPPELATSKHPYGVAVRHVWHACVAHGNKHMKRNGVVNPCYALPRQAGREVHEVAERAARELAATLAEEAEARHAAAAEEIHESVLPAVGWDELLGLEDNLALAH